MMLYVCMILGVLVFGDNNSVWYLLCFVFWVDGYQSGIQHEVRSMGVCGLDGNNFNTTQHLSS